MNGSAAVSRPVGRLVAAAGATLLAIVFSNGLGKRVLPAEQAQG